MSLFSQLKSGIILLRLPFSAFLLPVFLFALSQLPFYLTFIDFTRVWQVFFIWHLLVYPSSNAFNSLMDRDTTAIGGVKNPPLPPDGLRWLTIGMDLIAVAWAMTLDVRFGLLVFMYILSSRAYSYRPIRLKQYPYIGFVTVAVFQGAVVFWASLLGMGVSEILSKDLFIAGMACTLLLGSGYPLTQIYQHKEDRADGVKSISSVFGVWGTFIFSLTMMIAAFIALGIYFKSGDWSFIIQFGLVSLLSIFPLMYLIRWMLRVTHDKSQADYEHSIKFNVISSICLNIAFGLLFIYNYLI